MHGHAVLTRGDKIDCCTDANLSPLYVDNTYGGTDTVVDESGQPKVETLDVLQLHIDPIVRVVSWITNILAAISIATVAFSGSKLWFTILVVLSIVAP